MTQDKRLDKVEGSLTARQAVVLWLEEIRKYQDIYEYVRYIRSQPESEAPITKLTGQIDRAVREAMRGRPKQVIEAAVRRAVRDVVFLIKLYHQPNFKALTEQRAWGLMVAVLAETQNRMLTEGMLREVVDGYCRQCGKRRCSTRPALEKKVEGLSYWRAFAGAVLTEFYAFQDSVTLISRQYFDGHKLLFSDLESSLTKNIKDAEQVALMFNEMCVEKAEQRYQIDLAEVRKGAGKKAIEQAAYLVDMAKAEALDALGDREAGLRIAERYL